MSFIEEDEDNGYDPELGKRVHEYLVKMGVETPMIEQTLSKNKQKKIIQKNFKEIMEALGYDLNDDSLKDTPKRVAKMYVNEFNAGLDYTQFPKATAIENKFKMHDMVKINNISIHSNCEHHAVIIAGLGNIAYIPAEKVIGLSKVNKIAQFFAKRFQVQERLGQQIFHALSYILETENIAVEITAKHYCVAARGIKDTNSSTTTSAIDGAFKNDPSTRAEFMATGKDIY